MGGIYGPAVDKYIAEQRRLLGLENPPPGALGLLPTPGAMVSPPAVVVTQTGEYPAWDNTGTDYELRTAEPPSTYFGAAITEVTKGDGQKYKTSTGTITVISGSNIFPPWVQEFETDAQVIEIAEDNQGGGIAFMVDEGAGPGWVPCAQNLIANGDFEDNRGTSGWAAVNGASIAQDKTDCDDGFGSTSMKITGSSQYFGAQYDLGFAYNAGDHFSIGLSVRSNIPTNNSNPLNIFIGNSQGSHIVNQDVAYTDCQDWTRVTFNATIPSGGTGNLFLVVDGGAGSGSYGSRWIKVDSIKVERGDAITGFGGDGTYFWRLPSDNLTTVFKLTFPTGPWKMRRITVLRDGQMGEPRFKGLRVGPLDSIIPSSAPVGPRVMFCVDSVSDERYINRAMPQVVGDLLGWRDLWLSSSGDTSWYLEQNGRYSLQHRYPLDIIPHAPDILVIALSGDFGSSLAHVDAAVRATIQGIKAGLPECKIIVLANWSRNNAGPTPNFVQQRDTVVTAARAAGADLVLDAVGGTVPYDGTLAHYDTTGWLEGTGYAGHTTGSGNQDIMVAREGSIFTFRGHPYFGHRLAAAIRAAMPL